MEVLRCERLVKTYGAGTRSNVAFNNINLSLQENEILGILGKSGSGKSTLIRCLLGLEEPSSGEIRILQERITGLKKTDRQRFCAKLSWVSQEYHLLSSRTVFENVALPLRLQRIPENEIQARVNDLLVEVGLNEKKNAYPAMLSGGQQQRVAIARALAPRPKILLCDEPTSALDVFTSRSVLKLLKTIHENFGLSIILVTHDENLAQSFCHRIFNMEEE